MKKFIPITFILFICGCSYVATTFTPSKKYEITESNISKSANRYFWDNYHQGNYDSIPRMIEKLNIALQENPNDIITTSHLGFVHIWALAERQRLAEPNPRITENILLSKRYFQEANLMNPHDLRVLGFLADLTLAEGSTFNNKKELTNGYFLGMKSIRKWPQFNKFTIGYFFSSLDKTDKNFQKGLDWQYSTIDDCACEKNTRENLVSAIEKIKNSKDPVIFRACWNSWIAPHNWEGYCLNWGDMLVKNGELEEAKKIYALAKESDSYNEWPYKSELENRIDNVNKNSIDFNKELDETKINTQNVIMFNSKMSCMGCHQMSEKEFEKFGHKDLKLNYYTSKK